MLRLIFLPGIYVGLHITEHQYCNQLIFWSSHKSMLVKASHISIFSSAESFQLSYSDSVEILSLFAAVFDGLPFSIRIGWNFVIGVCESSSHSCGHFWKR